MDQDDSHINRKSIRKLSNDTRCNRFPTMVGQGTVANSGEVIMSGARGGWRTRRGALNGHNQDILVSFESPKIPLLNAYRTAYSHDVIK